jgi:protein involved in polysaccharide export with SLBB domain/uncharacterized protein involved in exopolysaccharide biosynthesis
MFEDAGRRHQQQETPPDEVKLPFDPWRFLAAVKRRWYWLLIAAAVLGALGGLAASKVFKYKVTVHLIRNQITDPLNPNPDPTRQQLSDMTLFAFMRSGEVLRRVAEAAGRATPPIKITGEQLAKMVAIQPTANPDILGVSVSGTERSARLADIANIYAEQVVAYTREIQASESGGVATYLQTKALQAQEDWRKAAQELADFQKANGIINVDKETEAMFTEISTYRANLETARTDLSMVQRKMFGLEKELKNLTPKDDKLRAAKDKLAMAKLRYTDLHPEIIAAKNEIAMLEKTAGNDKTVDNIEMTPATFGGTLYLQRLDYASQAEALSNRVARLETLYNQAQDKLKGLSEKSAEFGQLKAKVTSADTTRQMLQTRARDTKMFIDGAMGYYRVYGQASAKDIDWKRRAMKIAAVTGFAAASGLVIGMLLACFIEVSDTRLKTVADIERVTKLPVLATLGDLKKMSPDDQIGWAFRTLTILRGKLCKSPDDALVCGIISSRNGEGRSTWVNQLVSAASQRGLRVLTVDTRPTADGPKTEPRPPSYATASAKGDATEEEGAPRRGPIVTPPPSMSKEDQAASDLLSQPMAVAERLKDPESIVHIPIPGWVWSLQRRQQWQEALQQWKEIDNTVILIELPPANHPEAILLAEKIPQLIWLVGSGMADVQETREQLETLRHAHCNIVGAVLNQAPPPPMNARIARWFRKGSAMVLLGLGLCLPAVAQDQKPNATANANANTGAQAQKLAFSGTAEVRRAKWQERLTLGPGDAMDISLYGHPELTRTNIFIGPDGRLSYLQVQGMKADGLTIEELRAKLDEELAKYYNVARTMVVPTVFTSKKYYVLGKVNSKGSYSLDRPMTLIEAVARAQGLETGMYERTTVEMADLQRSFLIRNGEKVDVDFEKLFYDGDLTQNIMIEPNDFLFFGAAAAREIYVLGQVMNPGAVGFVPNATLITAITDRGGFTDRAYKGKVLVVRGSLNNPETFIIDTKQILDASKPDFRLESKDIVYVGQRPWIKVEELLDEATQSFIQGFVTAFTGVKIGPWIKHPLFGN